MTILDEKLLSRVRFGDVCCAILGNLTFYFVVTFPSLESMSESSSQDEEQLEKMNARMERRRSRDSVCEPEFQQELRNLEVPEGDTVYLTIKTTGTPEPEITWYRSGQLLKEDSRVKFIKDAETGTYSLLINRAAVEDEGEYRCVASNMGGSVACQAKLIVKGKEMSAFAIRGYLKPRSGSQLKRTVQGMRA